MSVKAKNKERPTENNSPRPSKFLSRFLFLTSALTAVSCSGSSICSDPDVLQTVKKLFDQQQFGQFIEAPPKAFVLQPKSATLNSTDKQSGKHRCSVIVVADLIELMRLSQTSEEDITKIKIEAPKKGMPLTKEDIITFTVQPMASGQNYVTVLP